MLQTPPFCSKAGRKSTFTRRSVLIGMGLLSVMPVAAKAAPALPFTPLPPQVEARYRATYAAAPNEQFPIPAIDVTKIDPRYLRQVVPYESREWPGTIIVDPYNHFLYLILEGGKAIRYGVGVGRQGFEWSGRATIRRKAEWPTWTPPREMIERQPELVKYQNGMAPGLNNPLGARALYLYQNGRDTLYRLHGTNEPWSIGRSVSSGCIRLFNQDIIDLYNRTPLDTTVVVLDANAAQDALPREANGAFAAPNGR